jgi:phospholipase C
VTAKVPDRAARKRSLGRLRRRPLVAIATLLILAAIALVSITAASGTSSPIKHVVVIIQENHTFDNLLGQLCIQDHRDCSAVASGKNKRGETIPLSRASDFVPSVNHTQLAQLRAMDGGRMDGFEGIIGCHKDQCYTQYDPSQVPVLAALARAGAISDAFFSRAIVPSWGDHVDFFAQTLDGFVGENPDHLAIAPPLGPGWGCDSNRDTPWVDPVTGRKLLEPSCIPDQNGRGPYRQSPVQYVPTFADRVEAADKTWGIFGGVTPAVRHPLSAYKWSICPSFAECLYGPQRNDMHEESELFAEAEAGTLPSFSIVIPSNGPSGSTSQHNDTSMLLGDNQIGKEVSTIMNGPDGPSTTIFIYYDDCGCFYDHVTPPPGLGIRVPLVIVSQYAKPGHTDHNVATNSSILAYAENVLGVSPVTEEDAKAYDFHGSFDYSAPRRARFNFHPTEVPLDSRELHPPPDIT